MHAILKEIQKTGIVPVVVINDSKDAEPLAKALCEGGLPCAEITFRTAAAEESIRIITESFPEMLVGAGTVFTKEHVDCAVGAGASFIVSPGLNPVVVEYCQSKEIPIIPGAVTPTELEAALSYGLEVIKFFPAEASGGLDMIKALAAPFATMKFMPTGGIHAGNINTYLAFPKIVACGGSWMVKNEFVDNGNFEKIKKLTQEAVHLIRRGMIDYA